MFRAAGPSRIWLLAHETPKLRLSTSNPQTSVFLRRPEFPSQCCYFPFAFSRRVKDRFSN
jgi:hypothetical protein